MRIILLLCLVTVVILPAQTSITPVQAGLTASIHGIVTDQQGKPISGALVTVSRVFSIADKSAPVNQQLRTISDGSFSADKLTPGTYSYCAQVPGDGYLNGCFWSSGIPTTLTAGQSFQASITVLTGSVLKIRVLDPGNLAVQSATQKTPPIMMGVWDARGRFLPVHLAGRDAGGLNYQLTVPLEGPRQGHSRS